MVYEGRCIVSAITVADLEPDLVLGMFDAIVDEEELTAVKGILKRSKMF